MLIKRVHGRYWCPGCPAHGMHEMGQACMFGKGLKELYPYASIKAYHLPMHPHRVMGLALMCSSKWSHASRSPLREKLCAGGAVCMGAPGMLSGWGLLGLFFVQPHYHQPLQHLHQFAT